MKKLGRTLQYISVNILLSQCVNHSFIIPQFIDIHLYIYISVPQLPLPKYSV